MDNYTVTLPTTSSTPLVLKNPILTASGTFGYGAEFMGYGDLSQLGGIIVKGISLKPRKGNPSPRIAETPCGMLNSIGLQNDGVELFIKRKLSRLPWKETPVIANLYATSIEEFSELTAILSVEEGVAALEINISCPNVKSGGAFFGQDPNLAAKVTEAVCKNAGSKSVWVKLSPNVTDITIIAKAVESAGADAISCINTLAGMAVDIRKRKPLLSTVIGGLSGPGIKPIALRCVWEVCKAVNIPVIGIGGVTSARDVLEFILVGAHAVQVGTMNFIQPDIAFRIAETLPTICNELGIENFDSFRGSLQVE